MSYHKTIIQGNLGRDPETRYLQNGDPVCNFSVAVTEKFSGKENTTWYRCVAFRKTAEIAGQYLNKGSQCLLEGKMQCRQWEDKEGNKRESWELVIDRLVLIGGGQKSEPSQPKETPKQYASNVADMDDGIPFN